MGPAVAYSDACLGSLGSLEQNGAYSGGAHTGTDELCERGEHIEIMGIPPGCAAPLLSRVPSTFLRLSHAAPSSARAVFTVQLSRVSGECSFVIVSSGVFGLLL